jgi:secreted protein with Ig-like and vWFA domain
MTSDAQTPLDPADRDALLSAYALGELEGAERATVERLLADPAAADARRIVAESRAVAEALRAVAADDVAPKSSELRRAVVAALARNPGPAAPSPPRVARPSRRLVSALLAMTGALAASLLVAFTLVPSVRLEREVARRNAAPQAEALRPVDGKLVDAESVTRGERLAGREAADQGLRGGQAAGAPARPAPAAAAPSESPDPAATVAPPISAAPRSPAVAADAPIVARELEESVSDEIKVSEAASGRRGAVYGGGVGVGNATPRQAFSLSDGLQGELRRDKSAAGPGRDDRITGVPLEREGREQYGRFQEHRFLNVADRPLSTFSIDVDTASYTVVRRFLTAGQLPPPDAVRIEEFVNYFRYSYPRPAGDEPFAVALEAADCPWHSGHRLVRIGIAGREIDRAKRPAGNLVFLIDVSGSMDEPDKLPLVKQALAMLVEELTENDRVSIVTYAGDAGLKLPPTSGDQKRKILDVIEGLSAGGSTHGSAGIALAYEQAREKFVPGGANRVILCTDGDLNVGVTSDAALVDLITEKARGGTFLTVLGFGRGNLQDEKMEKIADNGNGVYAYVDGAREARKVLVEQLTGSTITIAKDVKIQVEFNPAQVASYRLLGYENRKLADADFRDDKKDAGEIGAGHTVTALYEIVPAGGATGDGPGPGAEPLKYQAEKPRAADSTPTPTGPASRELLTVKLRFKQPEGRESVLREFPLDDHGGAFAAATADTRFAAAVAAFGMILRSSEFKGEATLPMVATIATDALGPDEGGYRAEFLDLVRKAEILRANERR